MVTTRECFCAALWSGPLLRGDAIVVLCGEDGDVRLDVGVELLTRGAGALLLLSGGKNDPPRWVGARTLAPLALAKGVAHDRLVLEQESMNTREQAVNVVALAIDRGWSRLLLVASPYHLPRAFLTFIKVLRDVERELGIQIVGVPASQTPWWGKPAGMERTRIELLEDEFAKIETHSPDHVASFEQGLAYLGHWEGR